MAPQYNKSDSPHSVNDISETGAPEDPNPNPSVHPSTLAVLRDAAKMARLCPNAWVYNLSESDVASIGNAGKAPRGGSENVFERKGLQAAHLLRPFQDLGGRDGAWAKVCEQIDDEAERLDRPAEDQETLNSTLEWSQFDPRKYCAGITIKDGSIRQVSLELVVDLLPGGHSSRVGPHRCSNDISRHISTSSMRQLEPIPPSSSVPLCMTGSLLLYRSQVVHTQLSALMIIYVPL